MQSSTYTNPAKNLNASLQNSEAANSKNNTSPVMSLMLSETSQPVNPNSNKATSNCEKYGDFESKYRPPAYENLAFNKPSKNVLPTTNQNKSYNICKCKKGNIFDCKKCTLNFPINVRRPRYSEKNEMVVNSLLQNHQNREGESRELFSSTNKVKKEEVVNSTFASSESSSSSSSISNDQTNPVSPVKTAPLLRPSPQPPSQSLISLMEICMGSNRKFIAAPNMKDFFKNHTGNNAKNTERPT
jgi:hypothetical protein